MEKRIVIVLKGGFSPEKEISKKTGEGVFKHLLESGKYKPVNIDPADFDTYVELIKKIREYEPYMVFNALHGEEGENGKLQALFDLEKIPYTGSNYLASAIAMDKYRANLVVKSLDIPIPDSIFINKNQYKKTKEFNIKRYPVVVKPNDKGSSVGISIVKEKEKLQDSILEAFKFSDNVLIEEYIPGRELTVTILGNTALPVVEIKPKEGWYDYKNKYTKGKSEYIVPAKLTKQERETIQNYALKIYKNIGCEVYARIDFRYDGEKFYFLEVNTLPGMTPLSLTPKAAMAHGISFGELLEYIIENSKRRLL